MAENIRQYDKSMAHDTRNHVNDGMKCVGKGLWHEDCKIHYRKTAETIYLTQQSFHSIHLKTFIKL